MLKNRWMALAAAGLMGLAIPALSYARPVKHATVSHKTAVMHAAPKKIVKKPIAHTAVKKTVHKTVAVKHGKKVAVKPAYHKPVKKASHRKAPVKHVVSHAKKA